MSAIFSLIKKNSFFLTNAMEINVYEKLSKCLTCIKVSNRHRCIWEKLRKNILFDLISPLTLIKSKCFVIQIFN